MKSLKCPYFSTILTVLSGAKLSHVAKLHEQRGGGVTFKLLLKVLAHDSSAPRSACEA
jgi:hypothetical protein